MILKVGPGYDLFSRRESRARFDLDSHAERGGAHRARSLEALGGLDEAPRRHGAHLDVPGLDERVAADDAPAIVEHLQHRDALTERKHELVGQHGREQLAHLAALDADERRDRAEHRRRHGRGALALPKGEERRPPRARCPRCCAQEGDRRDGPRRGVAGRRGLQCAARVAGRDGERARHGSARGVMLQDLLFRLWGSRWRDILPPWQDGSVCYLIPGKISWFV